MPKACNGWRADQQDDESSKNRSNKNDMATYCYVPSGSMANQIALKLHCQPGEEVVDRRGLAQLPLRSGRGRRHRRRAVRDGGRGGTVHRRPTSRRRSSPRATTAWRPPAWSAWRTRTTGAAARSGRSRQRGRGGGGCARRQGLALPPRRRPPAERGRRAAARRRPTWRRPSTPSASASRRGWARRWARCSPAAASTATGPTGCARCWAAACARRACWRRRRCTPWTTTSSAWPRTTPTPACWASGWRRSTGLVVDLGRVAPTS